MLTLKLWILTPIGWVHLSTNAARFISELFKDLGLRICGFIPHKRKEQEEV